TPPPRVSSRGDPEGDGAWSRASASGSFRWWTGRLDQGSPSLTALLEGGNPRSIEASNVPLCTWRWQRRSSKISLYYQLLGSFNGGVCGARVELRCSDLLIF